MPSQQTAPARVADAIRIPVHISVQSDDLSILICSEVILLLEIFWTVLLVDLFCGVATTSCVKLHF
jgi:hypothetical protein